jgi:hypothetical protein
MQARETEYRLASALKQVELQGQMIAAIQQGGVERSDPSGNKYNIETQFSFLRDQLQDERQKRETL